MISTIITFIASVSLFITGGHLISTNLKLHHYADSDYKEIIMLKNKTSTHKKCFRHSKDENIKKVQTLRNGQYVTDFKVTELESQDTETSPSPEI